MVHVRPCRDDEREALLAIVNAAAEVYRGVIPADRWNEPYMPAHELDDEIAVDELEELIAEAWLCQAPKRLARDYMDGRRAT